MTDTFISTIRNALPMKELNFELASIFNRKDIDREWLDVICNSFLLFNSRKTLADKVEYLSLNHDKPLSYMEGTFRREATLCLLAEEAKVHLLDIEFSLFQFLVSYNITSLLWEDVFTRNKTYTKTQTDNLFLLMDCILGIKDPKKIESPRSREPIEKVLHYMFVHNWGFETCDPAILILLILGILPKYNGKPGPVGKKNKTTKKTSVAINDEARKCFSFIVGYWNHLGCIPTPSEDSFPWESDSSTNNASSVNKRFDPVSPPWHIYIKDFEMNRIWIYHALRKTIEMIKDRISEEGEQAKEQGHAGESNGILPSNKKADIVRISKKGITARIGKAQKLLFFKFERYHEFSRLTIDGPLYYQEDSRGIYITSPLFFSIAEGLRDGSIKEKQEK